MGSAAARQRKRHDALERRVEGLEKELHDARDAVMGEIGKLRDDQEQKWESLERRLARRETPRKSATGPAEAPGATGDAPEEAPSVAKPSAKAKFPKRLYPELVTKEPAPDDEEVYGAAWPLIKEWRRLWKTHTGVGKGLAWLETEERVRELEVTMLEEHGLTLPPEKQPLHGLWRSTQLNWRKETLHEVRRAVAWRHLVRKHASRAVCGGRIAARGCALRVSWNQTEHFGRGRRESLPSAQLFGNNGVSFWLFQLFPAEKPGGFPSPESGTGCIGSSTALSEQPPRGSGPEGSSIALLPKAAPEGHIRRG